MAKDNSNEFGLTLLEREIFLARDAKEKVGPLRRNTGFIGLTDIEVVRVEGVAMSAIGADKAVATATAHSREILARAA